jgi:hypothetical protein
MSGTSGVASWTNAFCFGPRWTTHIKVFLRSSSAWAFCIGWRNGSFQLQMSTLTGSGASLGSGLGASAMPKKSRPPSLEKRSRPFSLTAWPDGKPLMAAGTSSAAPPAAGAVQK